MHAFIHKCVMCTYYSKYCVDLVMADRKTGNKIEKNM